MCSTILRAVALGSLIALVRAATYLPDSSCATCAGSNSLPVPFNLSASQTDILDEGTSNSFWISSFLLGSDGHKYFVISHALDGSPASYRASILDVTNPSIRVQFSTADTANTSLYSDTGVFSFITSNFTFGATNHADGLSKMRTWSNYNSVQFDLTFETSSPVLLNGGTGSFEVTGGVGYEWSMPAGKTTGSLTIDGTTITVDTAQSQTWYDRQWGNIPQSWYWFEVHIEPMTDYPTGAVLSVWNWVDDISGDKNFATVREAPGIQRVVPVKNFSRNLNSVWTSTHTGHKYVQDFELLLEDGTSLSISSILEDQELWNESESGFEGYMTVTGSYKGIPGVRGFAVSEQLPNAYSAFS
ncbi:hypothetical protein BJY01DRAFT_263342 [Aspergillus pseudoustus]|uniref:AttH domain-containing protein n=1 Tax=Aspergillus pseudoustus TaxID=1810923 RepID=A0ABR4K227_9EURO